jgi:hypothetical protein
MGITTQSVPSKLRHLQSFVSSGVFYPPAGTTTVYVAVLGATAGAGISGRYGGGTGGGNISYGAYVQVNPQAPHTVTIGAGGTKASGNAGSAGNASGLTSFDGAITANAANAGNTGDNTSNWGNSGTSGSAGTLTAQTSLPSLNPGGSTVVRVSGGASGSNIAATSANNNGVSGVVHVFGY